MSRTELRCDAQRVHPETLVGVRVAVRSLPDVTVEHALDLFELAGAPMKCGKLLVRSPELGERVQFLNPKECTGSVWLVDYHRHLACVHVATIDGIEQAPPLTSETIAWTALRPCNGEPVR